MRIPKELHSQYGSKDGRKYFPKRALAQGFCNSLASELRNYSDMAQELTDAQKVEAQEAFSRLSEAPGARLAALSARG